MQTILIPVAERRIDRPVPIEVSGSYRFSYDFMRAPAIAMGAGENGLARALALVLATYRHPLLEKTENLRPKLNEQRSALEEMRRKLDRSRELANELELLGFRVAVAQLRRQTSVLSDELEELATEHAALESKVARLERGHDLINQRETWLNHLIKTVGPRRGFDPSATPVPGEFQRVARSLIPEDQPVTYSQWVFAALQHLGEEDPLFGVRAIHREERRR